MTVSDWWMFLSFYQNVLALPIGIVLVVLLLRAKTRRRRMAFAGLLLLAFVPHIQVHAGNLYFDYLCRTQAGEFIYRTVDNVEGILQMRPRDGSKDYFDRMAMGDIPEDPWGHTNWEAQSPQTMFVNPPWNNYLFFETVKPTTGYRYPGERGVTEKGKEEPGALYRRFYGYDQEKKKPMIVDYAATAVSKFGYTWRASNSLLQKGLSIHRGDIEVIDLKTGEVLGRMTGFYRARPPRICPSGKDDDFVYRFVSRVVRPLKPQQGIANREAS